MLSVSLVAWFLSSAMASNGSGTEALGMRLAEDQLRVLEENFSRGGRNPDGATLALIAAECGLSEEETLVSEEALPQHNTNK